MFRVLFPRATKPPTPTITLLVGDRARRHGIRRILTITTPRFRAGYGIYYVREDVGTADQLSFQGPSCRSPLVGDLLAAYLLSFPPRPRPVVPTPIPTRYPLRESSTLTLFRASAPLPDFPAATPPGAQLCVQRKRTRRHSSQDLFGLVRAAKICSAQHPTMEPHHSAVTRPQLGF